MGTRAIADNINFQYTDNSKTGIWDRGLVPLLQENPCMYKCWLWIFANAALATRIFVLPTSRLYCMSRISIAYWVSRQSHDLFPSDSDLSWCIFGLEISGEKAGRRAGKCSRVGAPGLREEMLSVNVTEGEMPHLSTGVSSIICGG